MFEKVQVVNDDKLDADFRRIVKGVEAPFAEMGLAEPLYEAFLEEETEWFQSDGRGEWPALADSTKAQKPFADLFMMQESKDLYFSLTRKGDKNAVLYQTSPTELLMGTSVPYAGFHMRQYKKRPKREPIRSQPREEFKRELLKRARKAASQYTRRHTTMIQTELEDF